MAALNAILLFIHLLLIQQTSPTPAAAPLEAYDPLRFWVQVGSIIGAVLAALTFVFTRTVPWVKARRGLRSIQKRIGAESYTPAGIENAFRNFVPPTCQDVDPSGGDEPRNVYGVKQPLFSALDDALSHPEANKYFILLADSGMGKTTALLNYYLRHIRRRRDPGYKLALIPLNIPDADARIAAVPNQEDTVLFLDALDEDTLAIVDYVERLRILLKATVNFRAILISCRTQFFSKDEEIPKETGRIRIADRRAGQEAEYFFQKIYLSPFSDAQVKKYLKRRYPFWRSERRLALQVAKKIHHLTARPMLLAHIEDLLKSQREFRFSYELYEAMVEAWLRREKGLVQEIDALRSFSELLAVDLYVKRAERKAEKIPQEELLALAKNWNVAVDDWKLSGRSLLNRDAEGNYKFAHRSIMEYLFVRRFLDGDLATTGTGWTDQMQLFLCEQLIKYTSQAPDNSVTLLPETVSKFLVSPPCLSRLAGALTVGRERSLLGGAENIAKTGVVILTSLLRAFDPRADVEWLQLQDIEIDGDIYRLRPLFRVRRYDTRIIHSARGSVHTHSTQVSYHKFPILYARETGRISLTTDYRGEIIRLNLDMPQMRDSEYYLKRGGETGAVLILEFRGPTPVEVSMMAVVIFAALQGSLSSSPGLP